MSLQNDSNGDSLETMSFGDHLEELRSRLIRSLLVVVVFAGIALVYQTELMTIVTAPHRKAMLQIDSSRVSQTLSIETGEIRKTIGDLDIRAVHQCLQQAINRSDWWQRWDRFRADAPQDETLSEFIRLFEERAEDLDGTLKTGDPLLRVPQSLAYSESLLTRIRESDKVPWGGQGALDEMQEILGTAADFWAIAQAKVLKESEWGGAAEEVDRKPVSAAELAATEEELRTLAQKIEKVEAKLVDWSRWFEKGKPLVLLAYTEAFFAYLKLGLFLGLICALPWISAEAWQFIAAGLYPGERRSVRPFLPVAFVLLAAGVNFAYWVLVPVGLSFLGGYGDPDLLAASFTLKDYMGLVFTLVLGMGLIFQLPLLMVLLSRSGILEVSFFREYRKVAIMTAVVFGAFLTPPDVVTQMLMAGPLVLLYELGIYASLVFGKPKRQESSPDEPA